MAGNKNSGNGIAFRLSENELEKKIDEFREEYGDGSKGMVTWERFCAFLGYSVEEVRECWKRGKEGTNAYSGRSVLLEKFATECRAMMFETCGKSQTLCRKLAEQDPLTGGDEQNKEKVFRIEFGGGDKRAEKART